jgi:formate C-acetyltransferase
MEEIDSIYSKDAQEAAKLVKGSCLRHDYDHAVPDWDRILKLGFPGMKAAMDASSATNDFARAMSIVADAMLRNVMRLAEVARRSPNASHPRIKAEIAALERLCVGPPRTAYEVMLFQLLFFIYGEHIDHLQVRSLGNWDRLLLPYYEADIASGRTTREAFKKQVRHFWWQWGSIDNWWGQPVYIGGTKADGSTEYNEVSRIVLEVTDELALPTPKLQLKIAVNTPDDILRKALDMARRHRSLVFCGEEPMAKAMASMGFSAEEARTLDIWGCYEFQPRAAANTTLPCVINMPRIVSDLLAEAKDGRFAAETFEDFEAAFHEMLRTRVAVSLDVVKDLEAHMDDYIPALVHSLSIGGCVRDGKNAIGNGMKYNLTVILQTGAGTAVDALAAVKEIVYEKREMTLAELGAVMAANWAGHDELRLRMRASRRKWGNNDPLANKLTHDLYHVFGNAVNGRPNSRDGTFFAAGHSIDYFVILGRGTGATPDGRKAGEEFSKNISPAPGADREGPTALIESIGAIDYHDIPCDIILDTTIHPTVVQGEKGLQAMRALVERYFAVGGCAIHFNVFSAEELRDAQAHPERYENLQVRVCGWNVRWNDMSKAEQDAYIRRAENVMQAF